MSTSKASQVHGIENQTAAVESEPLLNQEEGGDDEEGKGDDSLNSITEHRSRIGELPSVHKPGYGNWMWAEQHCARRSGITVAEAKLVQDAQVLYQDGSVDTSSFPPHFRCAQRYLKFFSTAHHMRASHGVVFALSCLFFRVEK